MHSFIKSHLILFIFSILTTNLFAQYGEQFSNRGFEQWISRDGKSVSEPVHWHSGGTATGTWAGFLSSQIEEAGHPRPGSTGSKAVKLVASSVMGVTANGNLTNGRMNAGSMSASGSGNYNYTQRSQSAYYTPISQVPDSMTVWVCFRCENSSNMARVKAVVHGDADYKLLANGSGEPNDKLVATAGLDFLPTSPVSGVYNWRRLSIPFVHNGPCTDIRYILFSATTNATPGVGNTSDNLLIDDILLVYNPTLALAQLPKNNFVPYETLNVSFSLSGTMSPDNLNAAANQVIVQLSDANGSFSNPRELGRTTTNTSAQLSVQIPNVPSGDHYKIRVVSTNYPMVGGNIQEISIDNSFIVSTTANPTNGGTVTGGGTFDFGQSCTVNATPATGYTFINWTENGNVVSSNSSYTFTVETNRNLMANFILNTYAVNATANPSAGGTVSGGGEYSHGQSCTLTASANTGYSFSNWTENGNVVSSDASYTFTVTGSCNLVANFTINTYAIEVSANPTNGGTVTGGNTYNYGQTCTVNATAATGYTFNNWTENGSVISNDATYTFTVNGHHNLVANFTLNTYTVAVSANPTAGGTVTGGNSYNYGQSCTVTASAHLGYTFINWTENGSVVSNNANYTFTVNGNRNLVAHFTINTYTVTVSANPTAGGTVANGGTFTYGQSCTVIATAAPGYSFINWTENGGFVSSNSSYTFAVNANRNLVAHFTANPLPTYTITVEANPANGGIVLGGGTYQEGQSCTLTALANEDCSFVKWTKNDSIVSTDSIYTFTVTASEMYVAHFQLPDHVKENTTTTTCQIFPNPFISSINIKSKIEIKSIRVYDLYGRLLKEKSVSESQPQLDMSELSAGVYLLQIDYGGSRSMYRVLKAK